LEDVWVSIKRSLRKAMHRMKLLEVKATKEKWGKGDKKCRRDAILDRTIGTIRMVDI